MTSLSSYILRLTRGLKLLESDNQGEKGRDGWGCRELTSFDGASQRMTVERVHLVLAARHTVEHRREFLLSADRSAIPHNRRAGEVERRHQMRALRRVRRSVVGGHEGLGCFGGEIGEPPRIRSLI